MPSYTVNFKDARFKAVKFRISARTRVASGERGARDTTSMVIELWVNSNNDQLPGEARTALFGYSFRPHTQEPDVVTVDVHKEGSDESTALCTYTFQRGWVTTYREYRPPGQADIMLYLKFRAMFSDSPTTEVDVS